MKTLDINQKLSKFTDNWQPHQIAIVDNMQVLLAKLKGEFVWHSHENEDELFQVIKGTLYMQFRDRTEVVHPGQIIVVPKGVEHNPCTKNNEEVHVLLFEKLSTAHTGTIKHELTQTTYPKI
ncbi:cupin domain-containing protein [Olleya sp. 1-3]|uniref:cupin domain-containing protein n=1 Tax=Olleya sp. 1-3 TaxID=2058323 RepID=UPI000C320BA8|nr:cupin domain-containing protein [Olleya sp. 1-3]PKG50089.1 cupin domain-containing protein [Olleya sp. 1-3]